MGHRDKLKTGDEWDICNSRLRRIYKYTERPGVCWKVKNGVNRRARRESKQELKNGQGN